MSEKMEQHIEEEAKEVKLPEVLLIDCEGIGENWENFKFIDVNANPWEGPQQLSQVKEPFAKNPKYGLELYYCTYDGCLTHERNNINAFPYLKRTEMIKMRRNFQLKGPVIVIAKGGHREHVLTTACQEFVMREVGHIREASLVERLQFHERDIAKASYEYRKKIATENYENTSRLMKKGF